MSLSTYEGPTQPNEDPSENVQQEVSDLHSTKLSPVMNEVTNNDRLAPKLEPFTLPTELSPVMNEVTNSDRLAPEQSLSHFRREETEGYHLIDILQNMFLGIPNIL